VVSNCSKNQKAASIHWMWQASNLTSMIWMSAWLHSLRRLRMNANLYQLSTGREKTKSSWRYSKMSFSRTPTGVERLLETFLPGWNSVSARSTSGIGIKEKSRDFQLPTIRRKNEQDLIHFYQLINEESRQQNGLRFWEAELRSQFHSKWQCRLKHDLYI
jgi:hypothetical protein